MAYFVLGMEVKQGKTVILLSPLSITAYQLRALVEIFSLIYLFIK